MGPRRSRIGHFRSQPLEMGQNGYFGVWRSGGIMWYAGWFRPSPMDSQIPCKRPMYFPGWLGGGPRAPEGVQKGSKRGSILGSKRVHFGVKWVGGLATPDPECIVYVAQPIQNGPRSIIWGSPNTCFEGPKSGVFRSGSSIPNTKCLYSDIYV